MMRSALLLALVPLLCCCSRSERTPSPVEPTLECADLPERAAPAGWVSAPADSGFSFHLPESCTSSGGLWPHGGTKWECGSIQADVVWGMWGRDSFGEGVSTESAIEGTSILEHVSKDDNTYQRIVWYRFGTNHEPIISAWSSDPADAPGVDSLARSGFAIPGSIDVCGKGGSSP